MYNTINVSLYNLNLLQKEKYFLVPIHILFQNEVCIPHHYINGIWVRIVFNKNRWALQNYYVHCEVLGAFFRAWQLQSIKATYSKSLHLTNQRGLFEGLFRNHNCLYFLGTGQKLQGIPLIDLTSWAEATNIFKFWIEQAEKTSEIGIFRFIWSLQNTCGLRWLPY